MNWGFVALFGAVILVALSLASKYGKKTEELKTAKDRIKRRAEEQYHAQKILSTYVNMPNHELNKRLHKKREAALKRMRSKN